MATRGFAPRPRASKMFTAQYPGTCANCDDDISPGDTVRYDPYDDLVHNRCAAAAQIATTPREGSVTVCPDCNMDHAGKCF